jgi:hypothetical protein
MESMGPGLMIENAGRFSLPLDIVEIAPNRSFAEDQAMFTERYFGDADSKDLEIWPVDFDTYPLINDGACFEWEEWPGAAYYLRSKAVDSATAPNGKRPRKKTQTLT